MKQGIRVDCDFNFQPENHLKPFVDAWDDEEEISIKVAAYFDVEQIDDEYDCDLILITFNGREANPEWLEGGMLEHLRDLAVAEYSYGF